MPKPRQFRTENKMSDLENVFNNQENAGEVLRRLSEQVQLLTQQFARLTVDNHREVTRAASDSSSTTGAHNAVKYLTNCQVTKQKL